MEGVSEELKSLVQAIAEDDTSGATELAIRAGEVLLVAKRHSLLREVAFALFQAKPMMAPLIKVASLALKDPSLIEAFVEGLRSAPAIAAEKAASWFSEASREGATVLTISASKVVEYTVEALSKKGLLRRLIVGESRPRCEGVGLAERLAKRVGEVMITYDCALPGLCTEDSLVLLGADAVLKEAIVNKAGSLALCLAARRALAKVMVVTTSHKVLEGEELEYFRLEEGRLLSGPVPFLDQQFEQVPLDLVSVLVTELGPIVP